MAIQPRLDKSIDRIVAIDNIPKVGREKQEKLRSVLHKLFDTLNFSYINEYFPEDNGTFKGYFLKLK
jgi:hypothetical protein